MPTNKKFYITTPIYYASGQPHIGHAFSTIYADVICRYKKLLGYDAIMQTGMDEHGQKIDQAAKSNNLPTQEYVNQISVHFEKLWKLLDIDYKYFVRTSDPKHQQVVQQVFDEWQKANYIYLGKWEGLYCVKCEEPYTRIRAHLGESGKLLCEVGHELMKRTEPSYFFKMHEFESWIKDFYAKHPMFIVPKSRVSELTNSFLVEGLTDLSVSRINFDWGIPVLSDPKHVIYVWIDALLNYLTWLGYKQSDDHMFLEYWQNPDAEIVHVMSKEITRFHCIYWPIMLHCLNLRQPTRVISHGWIINKDTKMSKSLGNVINPITYIDQFGSDALRYFLMKELSLESDMVFSHDLFNEVYNADLANIYGNLVSRVMGMIQQYCHGTIITHPQVKQDIYTTFIMSTTELIDVCRSCINSFQIHELIKNVLTYAKSANKAIEDVKPWQLFKDHSQPELENFLFILANVVRVISVLLAPILTVGTKIINQQMRFNPDQLSLEQLLNFDLLHNHQIGESTPIYVRATNEKK